MSENQQQPVATATALAADLPTSVTSTADAAASQPTATGVATAAAAAAKLAMVGQTAGPTTLVNPKEVWEGLTEGPVDNKNVQLNMEYNLSTPVDLVDRKDLNAENEVMFFFAERGKHVDERIRAFVSPSTIKTTPGQNWNQSIVAAGGYSAFLDHRFEDITRREGSKYMQYLETESGKLGFTSPKIAESGAGPYTGAKGIMRARAIMGYGGLVSVPLWHSGFWVTLQAPPDSALIELNRRIQEEKIELGRETFGLVFSNEQSYINGWVLDFCMEYIYETTVRVDNYQELRPLIKIQDLNILFWGMACLIWPRGFDYVRSLLTKEGIENAKTISAKINVGKLMWVDNSSFDDNLRGHLASRQRGIHTVEKVKEFQNKLVPSLAQGRRVTVREGLDVLICSTHVDNYIADGENWVAGIVQTVDSTFTQAPPTPEERNRMITTHARASRLRNYGAWVKSVFIDNHENTERDDIAKLLDMLSMDDIATKLLESEITKFIDDSTRAIIAIPETSGKEVGLPRFPHLIPIDVLNTFFTLLAQRVAIISRR